MSKNSGSGAKGTSWESKRGKNLILQCQNYGKMFVIVNGQGATSSKGQKTLWSNMASITDIYTKKHWFVQGNCEIHSRSGQ